ncbi:hypothetical protein JL721_5084 [Aureococcus anophagefferens]|nr:hypothetical protein JL721_5084 [Aureococcus anophagefferens]
MSSDSSDDEPIANSLPARRKLLASRDRVVAFADGADDALADAVAAAAATGELCVLLNVDLQRLRPRLAARGAKPPAVIDGATAAKARGALYRGVVAASSWALCADALSNTLDVARVKRVVVGECEHVDAAGGFFLRLFAGRAPAASAPGLPALRDSRSAFRHSAAERHLRTLRGMRRLGATLTTDSAFAFLRAVEEVKRQGLQSEDPPPWLGSDAFEKLTANARRRCADGERPPKWGALAALLARFSSRASAALRAELENALAAPDDDLVVALERSRESVERDALKAAIDASWRRPPGGLPRALHERGVAVSVETLAVGDYVLSRRHAVERKNVDTGDLDSSLESGRLWTQLRSLEHHYANPLLLLEFERKTRPLSLRPLPDSLHARHPVAKLAKCVLEYPNARLLWSPSAADTPALFAALAGGGDVDVAGARALKDEQDFHRRALAKLPGVAKAPAAKRAFLLESDLCLADLATLTRDELGALLGPEAAEELAAFLDRDLRGGLREHEANVVDGERPPKRPRKRR